MKSNGDNGFRACAGARILITFLIPGFHSSPAIASPWENHSLDRKPRIHNSSSTLRVAAVRGSAIFTPRLSSTRRRNEARTSANNDREPARYPATIAPANNSAFVE